MDKISKFFKSREKSAAKSYKMPNPEGKEWDAIKSHYQLPKPTKVDYLLSMVTLPPGWSMVPDTNDPYERCSIIKDHECKDVGMVFLKNTSYDYHGYTEFYDSRLQELGILE